MRIAFLLFVCFMMHTICWLRFFIFIFYIFVSFLHLNIHAGTEILLSKGISMGYLHIFPVKIIIIINKLNGNIIIIRADQMRMEPWKRREWDAEIAFWVIVSFVFTKKKQPEWMDGRRNLIDSKICSYRSPSIQSLCFKFVFVLFWNINWLFYLY